ncbi:MAG: hypothetical protein MUC63_10355, partial [Planctomycetes bacterium]|nr:hypothetical protein [Planctomycetota bacterium]
MATPRAIAPENAPRLVCRRVIGTGRANDFAVLPGRRLAVASSLGILILDADTLADRGRIDPGNGALHVAASPDGARLAVVERSRSPLGDLRLRDGEGRLVDGFRSPAGGAGALAFSPDGRLFAAAGARDLLVHVHDARDGKRVARLRTHATSLAFSPDGRRLASGEPWGKVSLFDVPTGAPLWQRTLADAPTTWANALAWAPDGRTLYAAVGRVVFVLDASGRPTGRWEPYGAEIRSLALAGDGAAAAAGGHAGERIARYDLAGGRKAVAPAGGWKVAALPGNSPPEDRFVALESVPGRLSRITVFDLEGRTRAERSWEDVGDCAALVASGEGFCAVYHRRSGDDTVVRVLDAAGGCRDLEAGPELRGDLRFGGGGRTAFAVGTNRRVLRIDLDEPAVRWTADLPAGEGIDSVRLSGDGSRIAVASHLREAEIGCNDMLPATIEGYDAVVHVLETETGRLAATLAGPRKPVSLVALDAARGFLLSKGEEWRLWDLRTGEVLRRFAIAWKPGPRAAGPEAAWEEVRAGRLPDPESFSPPAAPPVRCVARDR